MTCKQCQGVEEIFNPQVVHKELIHYRKEGPGKTTRMLIETITKEDVTGMTLLDIGGGLGAVQHALLEAGVESVTGVDASSAYLSAATAEAQRLRIHKKVSYHHGNFVELADQIEPADIVTLDRVICCYDDMEKLVVLSSTKAHRLYGLVYPRDTWWMKFWLGMQNAFYALQGSPFRSFLHPSRSVEAIIGRNGLRRHDYRQTLLWQVAVYSR